MIYWVILLFFFSIQRINKIEVKVPLLNKKIQGIDIYIFIVFAVMVMLVAFRKSSIGVDTSTYISQFEYVKAGNSYWELKKSWRLSNIEIGYFTLEWIVSRFSDAYFFMLVAAIISIAPILYIIKKYSTNVFFSIFIYVSFGYYCFSMTGMRQAIAIGICALAFNEMHEERIYRYLILVAIAFAFHKSAILFLPAYFVGKIHVNRNIIILYAIAIIMAFLCKGPILTLLNKYARFSYEVSQNAGGIRFYLVMLATTSIMLLEYKKFLEDKVNSEFFWMMALAAVIWPIASANANLFRLYYYFHIMVMVAVPRFISIHKKKNQIIYSIVFVAICIYAFQNYVLHSHMNFNPYQFFWQ